MPITDNNGSAFYDINFTRFFNQDVGTTLVSLSAWLGSEVTVVNRTGNSILLYSNGQFSDSFSFLLSANESFAVRGINNCNAVSAKTVAGSGPIYYQASRFSNFGH